MEDNTKVFIAYNRKLLRILKKLREWLDDGNTEDVKIMLDELIEDTESDIS